MEKRDIKNRIIVFGGDHHNMLGVVRGLGFKGLKTTVIITSNKPYSFVAKSKYIERAFIIKEKKEEALQTLWSISRSLEKRAIIVPTSDFAAELLDENYNALKKHFLLPSINKTQGQIVKYMDKFEQYELAQKNNIKMARSMVVELAFPGEIFDAEKYILKPIISAKGDKSDIKICEKNNITANLKKLKSIGYEKVLVQEFIDFDFELDMPGCTNGGKLIVPGVMRKIRIYPVKRGSTSYAKILRVPANSEIVRIASLMTTLNFSGVFDIEVFMKNNEVYLNEINFRNSGTSFAYSHVGISLIYDWILLMLFGSTGKERITINDDYLFIDERLELKGLLSRNVSLKDYSSARRKAKARLLHCRKDIKPSIYKILYAIRNRIAK